MLGLWYKSVNLSADPFSQAHPSTFRGHYLNLILSNRNLILSNRNLIQVHPNTFRGQAAIDWLRGHAARALFGSEAEKVLIRLFGTVCTGVPRP